MSMNFNLTNTNGTSSIKPRLKPWEIHDVIFKGITFNEFKGKKDPDAVYKEFHSRMRMVFMKKQYSVLKRGMM